MSRIIVITSGKGGVGKTTVTANLGRALSRIGQRVVVLDVDLGLNNLDVVLGIENKVVYDLVDVIEGRCRIKQALIQDTAEQGLFILPSCHSYDKSRITAQNIRSVVASLSMSHDYVLIDCPAGIETGFHRAVAASNEALVVITPHISSIRDADKVIALLATYDMLNVGIIVNRARGDLMLSSEMIDIDDIISVLKKCPVGVIPEDDCLNIYNNMRADSGKASESALAFEVLAANLHNGQNDIFDVTQRYKGIFGKLKRNLRKMV